MKSRKILCALLAVAMTLGMTTGCIKDDPDNPPDSISTGGAASIDDPPAMVIDEDVLDELGLSVFVRDDGEQFFRFNETKHITVQIWDRGRDDGKTDPTECYWAQWIKAQVLRDLNIVVDYYGTPRDTEEQEIANLLASGSAPDIVLSYNNPALQTFADMGGMLNLDPYVTGLAWMAPNMWDLLGTEFIYFNRDPNDGKIWSISGIRYGQTRINTFVREDWLKKLNYAEPKTIDEFEAMLREFQANAQLLLGADADKMIPFSLGTDIGWRADHLLASFVPNDITDKELYTRGFCDRMFTFTGIKEGVRKLNDWYNAGLIWQDFHLHGGRTDDTEDKNLAQGLVGAFINGWSIPYDAHELGIQGQMRRDVDPSASFIPVTAFQNDAGLYRKFLPAASDRFIAFPRTNQEPEASLLYLDYMSRLEVRTYLGAGVEGVNFERVLNNNGEFYAVRSTPPTSEAVRNLEFISDPDVINPRTGTNTWTHGELIMNREANFDYLMTFNTDGNIFFETDEISAASRGFTFTETEPDVIGRAVVYSSLDGRVRANVQLGAIDAESGMARSLQDKRDTALVNSVRAAPGQFDSVFDSAMNDYLASGGQRIIDERTQKWEATYGSAVSLSEID